MRGCRVVIGSAMALALGVGVVGALRGSGTSGGDSTGAPGLRRGAVAPAFAVPNGREFVDARILAGRRTVLAFVRPSCRPCAADMRSLDVVAPKAVGPAGSDTIYLAVNGPGGGGWTAVTDYAHSLGVTAGLMYAGDPGGTVARGFHVRAPGTVFVIGADHRVAWVGVDPSAATLRAALAHVAP
jgi:hypothetical protein